MQGKGFYLPLKRSIYLVIYSVLLHIMAVISVLLLSMNPLIKTLLATGIFISQFLYIYRLGFIGNYTKRPAALINPVNEYWQIRYADNSQTPDLLLESAWVTRFAVIINFKASDKRYHSILILKDAVDKELLRQLRVRLRLAFFRQ